MLIFMKYLIILYIVIVIMHYYSAEISIDKFKLNYLLLCFAGKIPL